jgi:hypothetical protein
LLDGVQVQRLCLGITRTRNFDLRRRLHDQRWPMC